MTDVVVAAADAVAADGAGSRGVAEQGTLR